MQGASTLECVFCLATGHQQTPGVAPGACTTSHRVLLPQHHQHCSCRHTLSTKLGYQNLQRAVQRCSIFELPTNVQSLEIVGMALHSLGWHSEVAVGMAAQTERAWCDTQHTQRTTTTKQLVAQGAD